MRSDFKHRPMLSLWSEWSSPLTICLIQQWKFSACFPNSVKLTRLLAVSIFSTSLNFACIYIDKYIIRIFYFILLTLGEEIICICLVIYISH